MAPIAMRAFKLALEKRTFDRAYLFHGDNDYLKELKVRQLIDRATDEGTRDFNLDVRRGGDLDPRDLAQTLGSSPMMAERRVLVVRDAAAIKKDGRAVLIAYLKNPVPDIVLLLIAASGTKLDDRLLEATSALEFKQLREDDLLTWTTEHATILGARLTPEAVRLLCAATGNDLSLLAGELEKLRNYTGGDEITEAAVADVVGVQHGETTADLLDAVAERDGVRAEALVERVLTQAKTSAVSVLMAMITQILAIGWALAAREGGLAQHQLEREFYGLLKENPSAVVGRPWSEGAKTWVRALPRWNAAAIDDALGRLMSAEATLKDTRISSEEHVLRTLVLAIGVRRP